ncbi:MAG TPA: FecR family protein, partial [Candidatus Limnocylindria bacterium]|nr:FecR family protein [Candidatus Limnocylindria bacterium]
MRRTKRGAVIASCIALCVAMVLAANGAPVAAKVQAPVQARLQPAAILTVISGSVLARFGAAGFSTALDGTVLYVGTTIRTSADSRAVITLFEGSTVELEPASDITIEAADTRDGATIVRLAQTLGRSWHVVTHLTNADSRYEVRTPAATASVRGTSFEVAVEDGL